MENIQNDSTSRSSDKQRRAIYELTSNFVSDNEQDQHDLSCFCREVSQASSLSFRLIHGEAFGFPIKVNVEMIAMKTDLVNSKEFVLEVPTTSQDLEHSRHVAFTHALARVIETHATEKMQTLHLQGFEEHRWISFDLWMEALQQHDTCKHNVNSLELLQCALTMESFSNLPALPSLHRLLFSKCKLQERAIYRLLQKVSSSLQELKIEHCGEYMMPMILRLDLCTSSNLHRIHLDASHTLDSCSSRGLAKFRKALIALPLLNYLYLGDDDLPKDFVERLLLEVIPGSQTTATTMAVILPRTSTLTSALMDGLVLESRRLESFHNLTLDWANVPQHQKDQLLACLKRNNGDDLGLRFDCSFLEAWEILLPYHSRLRPFLCQPIPPGLWPHVLAGAQRHCSTTALYWLLRARGGVER